ncbi:hypothetical protein [Pseudoxanthomonas sp. CF125]|uniref:hypothetical protein n=1 Tax=Pseudoxanthomonas sp. CF125 TaxID=1855303 RepID=UPI0008816879|nr:hypothetical protein [Pseudoxanthomonas sp. CF125]SDQ55628.1 hypothetical protein SAMN05216569_1569 [Pseudoxanthomonas sp. CF125]
MNRNSDSRTARLRNGPKSHGPLFCGLLGLVLFFSAPADAQNLIGNPGFEANPPPAFGNNIGYPITPWTLGAGNSSNVVKVDGGSTFNYGTSGPRLDADPATGVGVRQHYLDIASGSNDFYQSFTVPACGGTQPGVTRQATFSGWFSTRDNLSAATASISIRQGVGTAGAVLATASASLPAPVSPVTSATAPWVQVSGVVNIPAGTTVSYVVSMDNNANFDEAALSFSTNQCVPAQLTLVKTWSNASAGDDATVTISRAGTVIDTLVSDAGAANETDTDSTPVTVYGGETLVLAETLAGSNTGLYNGVLTCTGDGVLSGNTLTVGSSGAAVVCRYTNTRRLSGLQITKTNTPGVNGDIDQASDTVTRGISTTYSIVAANTGPDAADGARLRDPASTGLTCTTATCAVTTGTATCPAATGAALVTALQSATGVAIPALSANSSITVTLTCTVQ